MHRLESLCYHACATMVEKRYNKPVVIIEPVPIHKHGRALRFLIDGWSCGESAPARIEEFQRRVSAGGRTSRLWWARKRRRCLGAAMIVENPGRTGMLFHSRAGAAGVEPDALVDVVKENSLDALARGMTMVQALLALDATEDVAVVVAAGYRRLAELIHMRLDLASAHAFDAGGDLTWRKYGQFGDAELAEIIVRTYRDSRDCAALAGVRRPSDVIAGHKSGGIFCPQWWWIIEREGEPAGCILVNRSESGEDAEVEYLGVAPSHRGRGLARTMVRRAAADLRSAGLPGLALTVDADNVYARNIYETEGFRTIRRRAAYVVTKKTRHETPEVRKL